MALERQDPAVFRLYADDELGKDGYPRAWHRIDADGPRIGIKDIVRTVAGHRCIRCGHPYQNGAHANGEWSPCDTGCTHGGPMRWRFNLEPPCDWLYGDTRQEEWKVAWGGDDMQVEAQWRILTVHHADGVKANCRWWNLLALCQRCHLTIQGRVVLERAFILEHSDWFKPYAAGWYAHKYLGEEVIREEALSRLDELLGLERVA